MATFLSMFRPHRCHGLLIAATLAMAGFLNAQPPADTEDIRGPKPMVEIPVTVTNDEAFWIGVAFGAGMVIVLIIWFIWNKLADRKKTASPREVALSSLRELEGSRKDLAADAFANRAAQTVREYISARFGLAAPRRTTEEFLRDLTKDASSPLAAESDQLKVFLKSCDLAKFAGSNLNDLQRDDLLLAARGFILAAAPVAPLVPAPFAPVKPPPLPPSAS